jgi:hypothetical protein
VGEDGRCSAFGEAGGDQSELQSMEAGQGAVFGYFIVRVMHYSLSLALGVLLASLVWAFVQVAILARKERVVFKHRLALRVKDRVRMPVEDLWTVSRCSAIDLEKFTTAWLCIAEGLRIDAELMRPTDAIEDLYIYSEWYWSSLADDLADIFYEYVPVNAALELAQRDYGTVDDLLGVIVKESEARRNW